MINPYSETYWFGKAAHKKCCMDFQVFIHSFVENFHVTNIAAVLSIPYWLVLNHHLVATLCSSFRLGKMIIAHMLITIITNQPSTVHINTLLGTNISDEKSIVSR